ncbi:MAG: hypothetical protein P0Y65_13095 [Candidatus Devosia phytovorans]|uniref:Uncharacterized protein n=1 Tax=Candidatus Devosia phytovorans TaxID=3121372 RepID=A0AAJ5VT55_9HYPH|nr:hypothetical protein [Devosia sp.]WEK03137.1 MAG: hypothetical protein P0Y65_13095 [Devosia sp.]
MRIGLTAQQANLNALGRAASVALVGFMALALAACTTVEGGNALTDIGTFEREVMTSTARGVGLVPGEAPKEDLTQARAPLVLPSSGQALPAPTTQAAAAQLPVNSDTVRIDTANLSEADLQRLRNAKVVDLNSVAGRPLTEEEARTLTARMQKNNLDVSVANSDRPLYLPPAEYFTRVGDAELVCSIGNGEVVSLSDARCPEEVRKAIQDARRRSTPALSSGTAISNTQGVGLTKSETGQN